MSSLGDAMGLTLYIGAARADATPEQLAELRQQVVPLMEGVYVRTGDETAVRAAVRAIMGPGWEPSGEWAPWIANMTGGRHG